MSSAFRRVRIVVSLAATILACGAIAPAAEAGVTGCSVVGGHAVLTIDNAAMSFFNVEMPAAGDMTVNAVDGGGVSSPCAGINAATVTGLEIVGGAANEVVQLYTDNFPEAAIISFDGDTGTDNFSLLLGTEATTDDTVSLGLNGADIGGDGTDIDVSWTNTEQLSLGTYDGNDDIDLSGPNALGGDHGLSEFTVRAGSGNDTIVGSGSVEQIYADDPACAGADCGNDLVSDGGGADGIELKGGNDTLNVNAAVDAGDSIDGGDGEDTINYSARSAGVTLTPGDSTNNDGQGGVTEGDDLHGDFEVIIGTDYADNIDLSANEQAVVLQGAGGGDTLVATPFTDNVAGGDGDDLINGGDESDTYDMGSAEDGEDTINDSAGTADTADYSARSTNLTASFDGEANDGESGELDNLTSDIDVVITGDGADTFTTDSSGGHTFTAGDGTDTIIMEPSGSSTLTDTAYSGLGADVLSSIEMATVTFDPSATSFDASAFTGRATITGNALDNTILGGTGRDTIDAGAGADNVSAGAGADTLTGGTGSDTIGGGDGSDTLVEAADEGATATTSQITWSGGSVDGITGVELLNLTGGASANSYDVSAYDGVANIAGGSGADTFILGASVQADTMAGGDGLDTVRIAADTNITATATSITAFGTDSISDMEHVALSGGGAANTLDTRSFTTGTSTLLGGAGDDTLYGTSGNDTIDAGSGVETLTYSGDLNVTLSDTSVTATGQGTDTITGFDAASFVGGDGADTVNASGFTGSSTMSGGGGADSLTAGSGADTITPGAGADVIAAGDGNDTVILAGEGVTTLTDTSFTVPAEADTLSGVEVATIAGSESADTISAATFSGTVSIDAAGGNDIMYGGVGNDTLTGGSGTDRVRQVADADMVLAADSLTGMGTDALSGVERATLTGGASANTISASAFTGAVSIAGAAGADLITGGSGSDTLNGGTGNDTIRGGAGADSLAGAAGKDVLSGGSGADRLLGGTGRDRLTGGSGADRFDGGKGNDTLIARDSARDSRIRCGSGSGDRATVDRSKDKSRSIRNCESITRR